MMSNHQKAYIAYVQRHQGCCIADVDRACRVNPRAGHRHVYAGVQRLVRRGLLRAARKGTRVTLWTAI